jgi:tripartite-type tricarboxylate transporter receptor subunit TctC
VRQILRLLAHALLLAAPVAALAQAYPNRVVRIIVPYPAGGTVDAVARVVAQGLTEQMGQSFVVDNRGGANGTIGSDAVAKAQPDGYTLLVQASTFAANPLLQKNLPYDLMKDFTPISNIGSVPLIVTAYPGIPAANLREFIALVAATPDKYAFAAPPTGSAAHLAEEAIKAGAKMKIQLIPYKGTAPALTDVMGGHVSAMIDALPSSYPQVKGGKLKALAVTSPKRIAFIPNVPTVAESGLPGFDMVSWYGVWGPANMPKDLAARLSAEVRKAVRSPLANERLGDQGFDAVGSTPEEFVTYINQEYAKYGRIIKDANIKMAE